MLQKKIEKATTFFLFLSKACRDCSNEPLQLSVGIYILLLIVTNVIVFVVLLIFNFGMSTTLDSWLFFAQVGLIFVPGPFSETLPSCFRL